jgi:hypothetical protein
MSPKKKSRKAVRRRAPRQTPAGMGVFQSPKARMASLFQLVRTITSAADRAVAATQYPEDDRERQLLIFDVSQLERGSNALKSVSILCGEAYWEFASGIARQLFELVLNMEHLATFTDREEAIERYSAYGLLQKLEHLQMVYRYIQKSGRPAAVADALRAVETVLDDEKMFPFFRSKTKDGTLKNTGSWSGNKARYLAEKSKNPLRVAQYDVLFSAWSGEAHGTPGAVLAGRLPPHNAPEDIAAVKYGETVQTLGMATTLFVELWTLLPHAPQPTRAGQFAEWRTAARQEAINYQEALKYKLYTVSSLHESLPPEG